MNRLADFLEPYLTENHIGFTRSRLPNTLANAIAASNAGTYDLHLALHSNASPEEKAGQARGIQGYYYPTSTKGRRAAEVLTDALKAVYPDPDLVYTVPSTTIAELRRTKAPAVLMEIGYHDNRDDAAWLMSNLQTVAEALAKGLTQYFSLPFTPVCTRPGTRLSDAPNTAPGGYVVVCTRDGSPLNLRAEPSLAATRLAQIPADQPILLNERVQNGWAKVWYNALTGYAAAEYLCVCQGDSTTLARVNTDGSNLNLRSAPSLSASIIGRIPDNATVTVLEQAGAWVRVRWQNMTGYVMGEFLVM